MKRWNTMRLGMYGACVGFAYAGFTVARYWFLGELIGPYRINAAIGELIGGAMGGFILVAVVCAMRNILVRAK